MTRYTIPLDPTAPALLCAQHLLLFSLSQARQHESGICTGSDIEALHQYRVALRKSRALCVLLKRRLPAAQHQSLKQSLCSMMDATGRLRDLDVWLSRQQGYIRQLPQSLQPAACQLFERLATERTRRQAALQASMLSPQYQQQQQQLHQLLLQLTAPEPSTGQGAVTGGSETVAQWAAWALVRCYRKLSRDAQRLNESAADSQLHQLRIRAKKLRYLLELLGWLWPPQALAAVVKRLKQAQEQLGQFHDCAVLYQALLVLKQAQIEHEDKSKPELTAAVDVLLSLVAAEKATARQRALTRSQLLWGEQMAQAMESLHR